MSNTNTATTAADSKNTTFAVLAHIGGLFTSWIAPLVIFLIKKADPDEAFATEQAKEALNYQITLLLAYFVCFVLSFVLIGLFLFWVVIVANLVLCILAAVSASNGKAYRYPFTIRLIK